MKLLEEFQLLGGVRHVCLAEQGEVALSTFPSLLNESLAGAARVMNMMLSSTPDEHSGFSEVHIEMDDSQLMAITLDDTHQLILMTDREINYALVGTAVRAAKPRLRQLAQTATTGQPQSQPQVAPVDAPKEPPKLTEIAQPSAAHAEPQQRFNQHISALEPLLAEFVGPAAKVLLQRVRSSWPEGESNLSVRDLPAFCQQLAKYLDTDEQQSQFLRKARTSLQGNVS